MDKSTVDKIYMDKRKTGEVQNDCVDLEQDTGEQLEIFDNNNITMANNWLGEAGDNFLFAANSISASLEFALAFFEKNRGLLSQYELTFGKIDEDLAKLESVKEPD